MIIKSRILIDTTPSNFVHFHLRFIHPSILFQVKKMYENGLKKNLNCSSSQKISFFV